MSKSKVFLGDEDNKIIQQLSNKILKELDGYTLNQIETCFYKLTRIIKSSVIIDCSSLLDLQDENITSYNKLCNVTDEIDDSWIKLKKVIDNCPKDSVRFFHNENGWQLVITATSL